MSRLGRVSNVAMTCLVSIIVLELDIIRSVSGHPAWPRSFDMGPGRIVVEY